MGESESVAVSHYRIVQKLRAGGMAEVYLAEDQVLPRVVALKLLSADRNADDISRHRFMREAQAASSLSHPNIASIYEAGEDAGRVFIAMEYVDGESLEERIARGPLSNDEIVSIALQLVSAVQAAHSRGVIHRDLKPSNVMLTARGEVKVLDFGLAKFAADAPATDATAWKSDTGLVLGTVPYMSPEQALGRPADARSDIFSIGVLLYELVTGRLPFAGATAADTLVRIVNAQPEPLARFNYELPAEAERIIRKCLEKAPERRYQSAAELLVDLRNFDRDRFATPRPMRSKRWVLIAAASLVIAIVAGFAIWKRAAPAPDRPIDAEAYRLYLRGRQQWSTRTPEGLRAALDSFRQTIEIEPTFAPAYAGLADTYSLLERYASVPNAESRVRAIAAAERAVQLAPSLPEAHASLASVREVYEWDWDGADREYRAAIRLRPTYATAHHWRAMLLARLGRFEEARNEIALARELDPLSPAIAAAAANIDYYAGDYTRSIAAARTALRLDPEFEQARVQLALSLAFGTPASSPAEQAPSRRRPPETAAGTPPAQPAGRRRSNSAALQELQQARGSATVATAEAIIRARGGDVDAANGFLRAAEARPDAHSNGYAIAAVHMTLGDRDGALQWLRAAADAHSFWLASVAVDPVFAPLRDDPRFRELLARVRLAGHVQ
jgi:tetratricopeptide (TPR) repeat protein/tRNA A-37 threonylcarbamoyl transferase component Bud32